MLTTLLVAECVCKVCQCVLAVDHRLPGEQLQRTHHVLLLLAVAHNQALQRQLLGHQFGGGNGAGKAGQHANQCNMPAHGTGPDGLGQGAGAAYFHHNVCAAPVRGVQHGLCPVRGLLVVDDYIGPQRLQPGGLAVAGGGGNHTCPHAFGHLQGKDGNPAGALHQHGIASLQLAIYHQCTPCGQACGGEGGGLCVAVSPGGMGEGGGGQGDAFAGKPVTAITGHGAEVAGRLPPGQPLREKRRHHMVAHGKCMHAGANGRYHPGSVGHGNAVCSRGCGAAADQQVVVVERAGMQAHLNFARLGRRGVGQGGEV